MCRAGGRGGAPPSSPPAGCTSPGRRASAAGGSERLLVRDRGAQPILGDDVIRAQHRLGVGREPVAGLLERAPGLVVPGIGADDDPPHAADLPLQMGLQPRNVSYAPCWPARAVAAGCASSPPCTTP